MRFHGVWVFWLGAALSALWIDAPPVLAQAENLSGPLERTPTRLPLRQVPADVRDEVRQILEHATLYSHGPAESFAGDPNLKLISVMDHTPGERQFVTIEKFRDYYIGKRIMAPDQLEAFIADRQGQRDSHSSIGPATPSDTLVTLRLRMAARFPSTYCRTTSSTS